MPFLGPWFLMGMLGLAGAAIPIVIHLFFRSRYRTVAWAAMEFLLTSVEQTSRRLKFQELLLLIMRCALLLLLAFALARPALSLVAGSGGRDAVDAVFVIDTSFSMGAREGAKTRFDLAKAAALNAIDQLPPHSTLQIFTCGTSVSEPLLREVHNLDQARKVIEKLELTHQATDLSPGLDKAVEMLEASKAANRELYLFSDMQKQGLTQNANEINAKLSHAKSFATVYLVRCGTRQLSNAAVVEVVPQTGVPRPGQRVGFAVVVQNTGELPMTNLQVGLAVDGAMDGADTQSIVELGKGEKRVVALTARFEKPGLHTVTAFLSNDDLPGDNFLDRVVEVRDKVKVLVVDGNLNFREPSKSSSFYLVNALTPATEEKKADYYLQPEVILPRHAGGELLKDKAICILVNVPLSGELVADPEAPTKEFTDALVDFVRKGGGLLIYGGDNVKFENYNKTLGGLLPTPLSEIETYPLKDEIGLDRDSAQLAGFDHFRTAEAYDKMSAVPILQTLGIQEPGSAAGADGRKSPDNARVIFRYTNKKPAIVTAKVGFGEVMVVGTSADTGFQPKTFDFTWNWLRLWPGYVPLVDAKINYLLNAQAQSYNVLAGEAVRFAPPGEMAMRNFALIEPADRTGAKVFLLIEGQRVPLGLAKREKDRALVVTPNLLRAGVYWLTTRENDPGDRTPFAVAPDLRESANLDSLKDDEIDRQLGFSPVHVTAKEEQPAVFASERTNREWTSTILWLVLALAVGESMLAWFCGRAW